MARGVAGEAGVVEGEVFSDEARQAQEVVDLVDLDALAQVSWPFLGMLHNLDLYHLYCKEMPNSAISDELYSSNLLPKLTDFSDEQLQQLDDMGKGARR